MYYDTFMLNKQHYNVTHNIIHMYNVYVMYINGE